MIMPRNVILVCKEFRHRKYFHLEAQPHSSLKIIGGQPNQCRQNDLWAAINAARSSDYFPLVAGPRHASLRGLRVLMTNL